MTASAASDGRASKETRSPNPATQVMTSLLDECVLRSMTLFLTHSVRADGYVVSHVHGKLAGVASAGKTGSGKFQRTQFHWNMSPV